MGIAVITGSTSGIGRFIARGLIEAGWHLVLVARSAVKAEATRNWLLQAAPGMTVEIELADLSLMAEVSRAGEAIAARHARIGLLVLNAGTFQPRRHVTAEGHELVLAVNHLSPFMLMRTLVPALERGGARVVAVGSSMADRARIDPANLELRHGWNLVRSYAQSKLALMTTSFEWNRRLAPQVRVNVVHPGAVATDLIRVGGPIGWAWGIMGLFALTSEQGAAAPLRAALDPQMAGIGGHYLTPKGFKLPNRLALDLDLAGQVWDATELLLGPP